MPEYLAPGVFVEEIDSGSKPIEGVGVNTAAFIGYAKSGEFNKPTFITNWTQFCSNFGEEENAITFGLVKELGLSVGEVRSAKKASRKSWMEFASIAVQKAITEKRAAVKSFSEFLKKHEIPQSSTPYLEGAYLANSVRGFYDNGGGRAYIIRVARPEDMEALAFEPEPAAAAKAQKADLAAVPAQITAGPLLLTAQKPGTVGNDIKVEVEHVGEGGEFRVKVSQGDASESFPGTAKDKPLTLESVSDTINKGSRLVRMEVAKDVATATRPEARVFVLAGGSEAVTETQLAKSSGTTALTAKSPLSNGLANLRPNDFIGDEAQRTGIGGLFPIDGIQMIVAPDLMAGVWQREKISGVTGEAVVGPEVLVLDDKRRQAILDAQCALVAHCERMGNRMAILDPLPGLSPQEVNTVTMDTPYNCDNGQAALYYPWIRTVDPLNKGSQMCVPPSGHIAGVYARVGTERGVHKAPANEALVGAVALETDITKGEQELLNPNGINCIRAFPGMGIRVWGARTLATVSNPSFKYVNVRRLFNYLKDSLDRGMQWVVFEPNDLDLWGRVRRNINAFLYTEWMEGKLFGASPAEAFYVKCDGETNPQEMIDLGRLYVEIGINPVKPAEFVILRMGQWSGGSSASESL